MRRSEGAANAPAASVLGSPPRNVQLAAMALALVVPTMIARIAGAGWGEAATAGQIAFLVVVVWAILTGPRPAGPERSG